MDVSEPERSANIVTHQPFGGGLFDTKINFDTPRATPIESPSTALNKLFIYLYDDADKYRPV